MVSRACSILLHEQLIKSDHAITVLNKLQHEATHEPDCDCPICDAARYHRLLQQGLLLLIHRIGCTPPWLPRVVTQSQLKEATSEARINAAAYVVCEPPHSSSLQGYATVLGWLCELIGDYAPMPVEGGNQ